MKDEEKTVRTCLNCGKTFEVPKKMRPRTVCIKCTKEIIEKLTRPARARTEDRRIMVRLDRL